MATNFSDLYKWIRFEAIRQNDSDVLPEPDLDLALEYRIEFDEYFESYTVSDVNGQKSISPDVTGDAKRLLVLKTAFSILEPQDSFSYKTAVLSKTLEGTPGLEEQKENMKRDIRELENGSDGIPLEADNEFNLWYNSADRLESTLDEAKAESD